MSIIQGDALHLPLVDESIDAVVCDPPYNLSFMGKGWDTHSSPTAFAEWCETWAREAYRVLKPGGHLLAFGGTRTSHRLACGIEDAGFEMRDAITWLYSQGFSKSWNFWTRYQSKWCDCNGANMLPYSHADNTDLPRVREDIHSPTVARSTSQDAVLFTPMQRGRAGAGMGDPCAQRESGLVAGNGGASSEVDARREEPRMEGRDVHRAGEGLPNDKDAESPSGSGEWLRGRASTSDGVTDWSAGTPASRSASSEWQPSGQPARELDTVPGSQEPLDERALRDGPVCAGCGGLRQAYKGLGTALKPSSEPIIVARKPLGERTVAGNVQTWGTGAINVDGCRIAGNVPSVPQPRFGVQEGVTDFGAGVGRNGKMSAAPAGRWPTNCVLTHTPDCVEVGTRKVRSGTAVHENHPPGATAGGVTYGVYAQPARANQTYAADGLETIPAYECAAGCPVAELDAQSGEVGNGWKRNYGTDDYIGKQYKGGVFGGGGYTGNSTYTDTGGASRFFPTFRYQAKADSAERLRDGTTAHPTVKPLELTRWLVRLVTPPGGLVLDMFAGSGTTAEAALLEGFRCIAIERDASYLPLIRHRLNRRLDPVTYLRDTHATEDTLFGTMP